jgi:hypothetical protein
LGARAEAEGLDCRARRSWLDRLVGQPRRRGLSNLWYGAQFPAWLVRPVSSGLAGARDVGLDPGHAEGRRLAPGATLHMSQNGVWPIGMPRRASARVPHRVKQSQIFGKVTPRNWALQQAPKWLAHSQGWQSTANDRNPQPVSCLRAGWKPSISPGRS